MAVKIYSYTDKTQLTKNFNVQEFKCKCGRNHDIKISEELVNKLQEMTDLVGADYTIISSGHRCSTHDKNVGGSGVGPHIDGYAADCKFVKNGKPISTKLLSCVAQDMGFMGIANITTDYTWIHLDVKNRVYKGNEIINYHTLTSDFYKYYNITKEQINNLCNNKVIKSNNTSNINVSNNNNWNNNKNDEIKELQEIFVKKGYNVNVTGIVDDITYKICKKFTIEKNDSGPLTGWVQKRLKTLGYYNGLLDCRAGINTMNAIYKFQKDHNLGVGYLGGTDWKYLVN